MAQEKMDRMNWVTIVLALGIVILAIILAMYPFGQSGNATAQKTISVVGDAQKDVAPDEAKVLVRIDTVNNDSKISQGDNTRISNAVLNALRNYGINDSMIETSTYYLTQKYNYNPITQNSDFEGYETVNVLSVTTDDISGLGGIIDVSVGAGANGIDSVQFELKKDTAAAVRQALLAEASTQAKNKAQSISGALGLTINGVKSVSETSVNIIPFNEKVASPSNAGSTSILPQMIQTSAEVNVIYSIS